MKKIVALFLAVTIMLPCSIVISADAKGKSPERHVTKAQAIAFSDDLKEMDKNSDNVSCRLIVESEKEIDYRGAVDVATGIEGLYVLQYDSEEAAQKAFEYYDGLPYVSSVEFDSQVVLCDEDISESEDKDVDFTPVSICTATVNTDDAIKLIKKEKDISDLPEIRVGVIDSGISKIPFTEGRLDGGYTFIEDLDPDGTQDYLNHGTRTASTIIFNTLDNVRLYSYQFFGKDRIGNNADYIAAIYLAVSDGCDVINCSFSSMTSYEKDGSATKAVNYAVENGVTVVASAGNFSFSLDKNYRHPAAIPASLTVGSVDCSNHHSSFSNYGSFVDIYATGEQLSSYTNIGKFSNSWSGTSASAPVVSSICCLLLSVNPDLTSPEITELLQETGNAVNEDYRNDKNYLVADAYEAMKLLMGKELPQAQFDYNLNIPTTSYNSKLTFSADENTNVFYNMGYAIESRYLIKPFGSPFFATDKQYEPGTEIEMTFNKISTACAYSPGKAKSKMKIIMTASHLNKSGFDVTPANDETQNNIISQCKLTNSIIEVPQYVDDVEIQEIGAFCFAGNKTAETIILPKSVTKIDEYAFACCPNLKSVIAPGVTECKHYAFYDCENLEQVYIPKLTVANTGLFKDCTSLKTLECGTVTAIYNHAFYGCENLEYLKTSGDDIEFCARTFYKCNSLTINAPEGSSMYNYAVKNEIPVGEYTQTCPHTFFTQIAHKDPHCITHGYNVYKCNSCNYMYTEFIEETGHSYSKEIVPSTCTKFGYTIFTCTVCGYSYYGDYDYKLAPHDLYTWISLEPTETSTGREITSCRVCNMDFSVRIIPSLAPYNVSGKILVAENRNMESPNNYPLANVEIIVNDELVAITDEQGNFSANFQNGTYTALLNYKYGIDKEIEFTVTEESIKLEPVSMIACNWVKDDKINARDYSVLIHHMVNNSYNDYFDLDGGGTVDEKEKEIFENCITIE